jgi:hypothetical protein
LYQFLETLKENENPKNRITALGRISARDLSPLAQRNCETGPGTGGGAVAASGPGDKVQRLQHARRTEGVPGKVTAAETHCGGWATMRGNNGGVHWHLTVTGRLRQPVTSSVRPYSTRPVSGDFI